MDAPEDEHPEDRGLVYVDPLESRVAYGDMEDFVATVGDPRARGVLGRAIAGRGAFRRFKDALLDFPELRAAWFALLDARMERRALEWLVDRKLVDQAEAARQAAARPDPEPPAPAGVDAEEIARAVAGDLSELYGPWLRRVLLFGSWARGDAHPESDIDLLVVLDDMPSSWEEGARMDEVLWRRSLESGAVVCALPVDEADTRAPQRPVVARAVSEGRPVG
jgi:hypothetical protein